MMNGLQISIPQRMTLIRMVLILSMVISFLLSFNLWAGYRDFPYAALLHQNFIPAPYDYIPVIILLLIWISSLFFKRERLLLFIAFLISAYLAIMDLNRLQPWFYVYSLMLLVFVFYNGRVDDPNKYTSYFITLQIMFASVYFFCGLNQINSLFTVRDFPEIISPLQTMMSERQFLFFNKLGSVVPYLLLFVGLGLMISPIRYLAITLGICMHILLLIFLFPSEKNQNYALWFSNLCFLIIMFLMFSGKTKQRYYSPTFLFEVPVFYPMLFLFVVMPFFNSKNQWPDYLSFNIKSGNSNFAILSLSPSSTEQLPPYLKKYCEPDYTFMVFNYRKWCLEELNIDCYPEEPVFKSIYEYLKSNEGGGVKEIELRLVPKQKLLLKP